MSRKRQNIIAVFCLSIALILAWSTLDRAYWTFRLPPLVKISDLVESIEIKEEPLISLPLALEHQSSELGRLLELNQIEILTNRERELAGLSALERNGLLDQAAQLKLEEMFQLQYFDHDSPDGRGIDSLAQRAGYQFILIGENLAKGNFSSEQNLVEGWMNSPGHRQNILDQRYREIGLAARTGLFEGKNTWLAVQIFGLPISFCPSPVEDLKISIQERKVFMTEMHQELQDLQSALTDFWPRRGEAYYQLAERYNVLVQEYNQMVQETRGLIDEYNIQVAKFNRCINNL